MLKQRLITASVLLPLVVAAILWLPPVYFGLFVALFACIGAWEWTGFMCSEKSLRATLLRFLYAGLLASMLIAGWFYVLNNEQYLAILLGFACAWWCLAVVLILMYPGGSWFRKNLVLSSITGLLILSTTWIAIVALRNNYVAGIELLLYLIILIAAADTSAYFGGRRFGKHKLAPKVSPGKSWEGVFSAMIGVVMLAFLYAYLLGLQFEGWRNISIFVGISVVTAVFSVVGDLTESLYKREAGIKDSGIIFPGHGGVLDRIDSLTAAAPVFLAFISWFYIG